MGLDGRFGDWDWGPPPLQYNLLEQWISSNYFINLPEMRKSVKRGWWSLLRCSVGAISEPSYKIRLRRQIAVKRYISTTSDPPTEKRTATFLERMDAWQVGEEVWPPRRDPRGEPVMKLDGNRRIATTPIPEEQWFQQKSSSQ